MENVETPDLHAIYQEALAFAQQFKSVQLATCSPDGVPEASYACYLYKNGKYYLYLSRLATHFHHLFQHPRCSLLFIENEDKAKQLFARRRFSIQCSSTVIPRESEFFQQILNDFSERFGRFMGLIRDLSDFELFELSPEYGSFVAGFAKTYRLDHSFFSTNHEN